MSRGSLCTQEPAANSMSEKNLSSYAATSQDEGSVFFWSRDQICFKGSGQPPPDLQFPSGLLVGQSVKICAQLIGGTMNFTYEFHLVNPPYHS